MNGHHYKLEVKAVMKQGKLPAHQYSWEKVEHDWVYKEEGERIYRICRLTGRLEEMKEVPLENEEVFERVFQEFHQKAISKVDLDSLKTDNTKRIGYGVLINVHELNNEEPFDDAFTYDLEYTTIYEDREKQIVFFGEFIEENDPAILLDKVTLFPSDAFKEGLKTKLIKMGLTKEDIQNVGLHHYIL